MIIIIIFYSSQCPEKQRSPWSWVCPFLANIRGKSIPFAIYLSFTKDFHQHISYLTIYGKYHIMTLKKVWVLWHTLSLQLTYHIAKAVIAFDIHRLVQSSHSLHTSSQSLAPVPPLPEKGGQVRHGIIPEELFQLLYPKTGVTGMWALEGWVSCIYYLLNIIMTYLLSTGNIILMFFFFLA